MCSPRASARDTTQSSDAARSRVKRGGPKRRRVPVPPLTFLMITTVITRIVVVKHYVPEATVTRRRLPLDALPLTVRLPSAHVRAIKDLADRYDQDPAWAHRLAVVEGLKALAARGVVPPVEEEVPARLPDVLPPTRAATERGSRGREKGRGAGK